MKVNVGFKEKSANDLIGLTLDDVVEIRPMDDCVAFMREYGEGFTTSYRIEAIVPYSTIAYIFCEEKGEYDE